MDKYLPANARDTGSIPGLEDPACHRAAKPVLCKKRRHHSEKPKHCSLHNQRKPTESSEDPARTKINKITF